MDDFILIAVLLVLLIVPVIITIMNCINLITKKTIMENLNDSLTFIIGIPLTVLLFKIWSPLEYTEPLVLGGIGPEFHTPLAANFMKSFFVFVLLALIGYFILRVMKNMLSPIIMVICIAAIYIGLGICLLFIIQLSNNWFSDKGDFLDVIYMTLLPVNYILCSLRLIRKVIVTHILNLEKRNIFYERGILMFCHKFLSKISGWYIAAFVIMIPLLGILLMVLVMLGQKPDAIIRVFTETSDWALSQKISPPPIEYEGHYLCTVAVNGHRQIVRPTRLGIRHGVKITVNRQLCIANAFEDLIQEKTPKLHKIIRNFYNNYGYPISKHITSKFRADVTYIFMKPLEWLFLIVLYLFDINPENRIALQYTGQRSANIINQR